MSERDEARERNKHLRRTYTYQGPRYMARAIIGHGPPRWYSVWDQFLQEDVGQPIGDLVLAERRAQALNEAES